MSFENVKKLFTKAGLGERVQVLDQPTATVEMAAEAVGCATNQIVKTLSFLVTGTPLLVVAAGNVKVDNKKFKERFQGRPKMIERELVEEYIGHDAGGVCPFAVIPGVDIYLDISLKQNEIIYPGAGSANSLVKLTLNELEQVCHYKDWVDVCKPY